MNEDEIIKAISKYKFYHIIQLTDNISTPGNPRHVPAQNLCIKHLKALDLDGKRVLDIGCRDGLFSFIAESMGAKEVIGIDNDLSKPATEFLIPFFKSKVKMVEMNLYDLAPHSFGLFDVVLFPGVLYHLRYPFWGLKTIRDVLNIGGHLLIETAVWEGDHESPMLYCPIGEDSPYEDTSCTFFNRKGLVDTLLSMGFNTVSTEFLKRSDKNNFTHRFTNFRMRINSGIKLIINEELPNQKKKLNRGVFHSIYNGKEKNSRVVQYWEGTHSIHTDIGG